jgi:hypothetical protein
VAGNEIFSGFNLEMKSGRRKVRRPRTLRINKMQISRANVVASLGGTRGQHGSRTIQRIVMCTGGVIDLFGLIGKLHVSGSQNFPLGPKLRVSFFASALPSIVG